MDWPSVENIACLAASFAKLGRKEEAKQAAQKYLSHKKSRKMTKEQWILFWNQKLKFKRSEPVEHLISGL